MSSRPASRGCSIVGVEPKDSPILNGGDPGPHKIQGIGPNFIPEVLDRSIYDEIIDVQFDDAVTVARKLGHRRGHLGRHLGRRQRVGGVGAGQAAGNAGKLIVVVVPDFGERYISTPLFEHIREG